MENSFFLLNDADKGFFAKVNAAIEQALAEEGIEQRGEGMSITEEQARRISKRLPSAPSSIVEKWEELTRKPFFMLMETIERDASGNSLSNWFYMKSDSRDSFLAKMPLLYPVDASSEAHSVLSDLRDDLDSEAAIFRIAEVLNLEGYAYISLKAYSDIDFAVKVCREIASIPETLKSKPPESLVIPNNKLANRMTDPVLFEGITNLKVSEKKKKLITSACILIYEGDNVKLSGRQPFTEYDRNVLNAVVSLYVHGHPDHNFSPAMVYRAMTGMKESEHPSATQLAEITRSLDKMRFIRVRIDCTDELQKRRITIDSKQINSGFIDTYLLVLEKVELNVSGETMELYHIIKAPILYEYSSAVNQVLTIPISRLDIKELDSEGNVTERSLANTESRILIRGYLLRRIEGMKGKNALKSNIISLFDYEKDGEPRKGLYSIAGKPNPDRKEMQRIREDTEKMLAYWKATGYIPGYETIKTGHKIAGYRILLFPKNG